MHKATAALRRRAHLEVWRYQPSGREVVVDRSQAVYARPWIERIPAAHGAAGEIDVCWMCVIAVRSTTPQRAARFVQAHRHCGFKIAD